MLPVISVLVACAPDPDPGDPPWLPQVESPMWADETVPDLVLARRFAALLPDEVPTAIRCEAADDPDEVHELATPAEADRYVETVLYGLLADTTYDCTMTADGVEDRTSFTTGSLPDWLPSWHVEVTGQPYGGYVLLNHGTDIREDRQPKLLIVDVDGRLRWYRRIPYDAPDLDSQYVGESYLVYGGGYQVPPTMAHLSGEVLLRARELADDERYNHHVERLADTEVLTIGTATNKGDGDDWRGFELLILDPTMSFVTWRWNSQRGYDEGWLPHPEGEDFDPYHANATGVLESGDVWVNARSLSELYLVDRATGDREWTLGPGQDFRLVDAEGGDADPASWFYMPHAPEFRGDHAWFYDNGVGRPGGSFSRVVEMELDVEAKTARVVWSWSESGWYEPIWGDVDALPDGHVSFTRAHCGHCSSLTDQRTEVVEVDPATDEVVWRMTFEDPHDAGYRSERIAGCDLFGNRKYCPDGSR